MPPTHIVNGHVVRHSRLPQSRFLSWKRLFLLLVPALILVGTNPANQDYVFNTLLTDRTAGTSHVRGTFVFGRRITNNGLFSLEKTSDRLILHALQQSCSCSFNDDEIGWLCAKLASDLCHQKSLIWDVTDRVHTAHRLLCLVLILSAAFFFFCPDYSSTRLPLIHPASIFYRPNLFLDLLCVNMIVYPALVGMNEILPLLRPGSIFATGQADCNFVLNAVLLVVVVGNGANSLANRVCGNSSSDAYGFESVEAACLAYHLRLLGPIFWIAELPVTAQGIYWTNAALIMLNSNRKSRYPRLVAWLVAGCAGSLLAKYHLEDVFVVGKFFKFFNLV